MKTGDVTFTYSPSTATNKNVSVTITGNKTGYILQYKTAKTGVTSSGETGEWKNYTGTVKLKIGETIYAKGIDKENNETRDVSEYTAVLPDDALGIKASVIISAIEQEIEKAEE